MHESALTMSVTEAGAVLGCSRGLSYRLAREGKLPVLKLGRKLRVPRAALERMLENAGQPKEVKNE